MREEIERFGNYLSTVKRSSNNTKFYDRTGKTFGE